MSALRNRCVLWLCALALGCATGCAGGPAPRPTLSELRAQAEKAPNDAALQTRVALGELFAYDGDPARAESQLARARKLDGSNVALALAAGLHADVHGRPGAALQHYLDAIANAARAGSLEDALAAEIATLALSGLSDSVDDFIPRVDAALSRSLAKPGLPPAARFNAQLLRVELAQRRGDRPAAQALALENGCLTEWRVAGPFGPRELLGFDADHGVNPAQPLKASYDLGPGRGERSVRELGGRGCQVSLGGGPLGEGGTSYVQAKASIPRAGSYLLRLETPNSVVLYVDGKPSLSLDRRRVMDARVRFVELELSAGEHLLTLKLGTRHPSPVMSVALVPVTTADLARVQLPAEPKLEQGFARYLHSAAQLARGDVLGARQTLTRIKVGQKASPLLFMQRASVALGDPLVPSDVRDDDARQLLLAALQRDEGLWAPTVQLARLAADNGRSKEAIEVLRAAHAHWPEVPSLELALVELLRTQDWDAEADTLVRALNKRLPHACAPAYAELEMLRRMGREKAAAATVERVMTCDARANARYALLLRKRDFQAARGELTRLEALDPPQDRFGWLLAWAELGRNLGDAALVQRSLDELRRSYPRAVSPLLEHVDLLAAAGKLAEARQALDAGLAREPASLSELRRIAPVLGAADAMERYRKDGSAAIAAFEASGRTYPGPQVLVFDYMVARVFDDGSEQVLVHTIQKVQSDEAVDELAEVEVPEGARVLTLRLLKPDGRRLEPDQIGGKDTVSLPSVSVGDYVEVEYLLDSTPSGGFPNGYLGDRFYFRSFEVPFDSSHLVVVLPAHMEVLVDPRGDAPKAVQRMEDGLRVLEFAVEQSGPLSPEPGAVASREYIPSVRVGVNAGWEPFVEGIREVLVDRDLHDPAVDRLVQDLVEGAKSPMERAERLYDWVLENVENDDDLFSQAATMLRAKAGNRARVLHYMLGLAGVPSTLALARSATADAVRSAMADENTYEHLVLRVGMGADVRWLFTAERWAPFGFLPPPLRGQTALLLAPGLGEVRLPAEVAGADRRELALDVKLDAEGSAHVDVMETVHGTGAVGWRGQLESIPAAELERRFEDDYVARLVPGARLTALDIEGREQDAESIRLHYTFDVDVLGRKVPAGWALPPLFASELAANFARISARTTTELVATPIDNVLEIRLHLPPGQRAVELPPAASFGPQGGSAGRFALSYEKKGELLVLRRTVELPLQRVAPDQYPGFADFCRKVDLLEGQELLLSR